MPAWLPYVLTFVAAIFGAGCALLGSYLAARRQAKSADRSADAHVQQSINSGFEALTAGFTERMDQASAEITDLRGWIRELIQHIDSLESLLRAHAPEIPVPARRQYPHPFEVIHRNESRG